MYKHMIMAQQGNISMPILVIAYENGVTRE